LPNPWAKVAALWSGNGTSDDETAAALANSRHWHVDMTAAFKSEHMRSALSALLRLVSLASKLCLALYMGRYLSLADMGVYGLVFGAVMILTTVLGFRFDYVVSRDLVRTSPQTALAKMRDQTVFYAGNYFVGILLLAAVVRLGLVGAGGRILVYICILAITDNYVNLTYVNMNSMERPLRANALYFIAGGLWCFLVIGLGIARPAFRTVDTVLLGWIAGNLAFLAAAFWSWRALPWAKLRGLPIDWKWLGGGMKTSSLIWLGTVGTATGSYIDRFFVAHYLDLELVGVATFYFSFVLAILTLIQKGVLSFVYPRLVALNREARYADFWRETWAAVKYVALSAAAIGVAVGLAVPLLGIFFGRPQYYDHRWALWAIIVGIWIRCNSETFYQVLFARHQDRAIWLGDLLFLIPACACNALLVPDLGLVGIGCSAIVSNFFVFVWRAWHVRLGWRCST
jgi:O-antigen/teichoic acid export membrane protein